MPIQLEQEFKALISIALKESREAIERKDYATADYYMSEAFDLLSKLPENAEYMKVLQ